MANFNKMAKMAIMACHDIAINIVKIIVYLKNKKNVDYLWKWNKKYALV